MQLLRIYHTRIIARIMMYFIPHAIAHEKSQRTPVGMSLIISWDLSGIFHGSAHTSFNIDGTPKVMAMGNLMGYPLGCRTSYGTAHGISHDGSSHVYRGIFQQVNLYMPNGASNATSHVPLGYTIVTEASHR